MRLKEYLLWKKLSTPQFAKEIGYASSHVLKLMNSDGYLPKRGSKVYKFITKATQGLVTEDDIFNPENTPSVFDVIDENGKFKFPLTK